MLGFAPASLVTATKPIALASLRAPLGFSAFRSIDFCGFATVSFSIDYLYLPCLPPFFFFCSIFYGQVTVLYRFFFIFA